MPSDAPISGSDPGALSPALRAQAEAYAKARRDGGVDDAHFDVAAARAALARTERVASIAQPISHDTLGGVPVTCFGTGAPGLLYLHGGGFVGGNWRSHGHIAAALATELGTPALLPDYRLAPEHPFPAAFDDVEAVWDALDPDRPLVLAGDSVGAALALHLARRAAARGDTRIRALLLFAPMLDFDAHSSAYMKSHGRARAMIANAIRDTDLGDPRLDPLGADLAGLPPVLIQVGGADYVRDDGLRLAGALLEAQGTAALECWPHMPHVWHRYAPDAPEATNALRRAARFAQVQAPSD